MQTETPTMPAPGRSDVRRRRRLVCLTWLLYLPVVLLTDAITGSEEVVIGVGLCWMALFTIATLRVGLAQCPRCGNAFHYGWYYNPFRRRCAHCGLGIHDA